MLKPVLRTIIALGLVAALNASLFAQRRAGPPRRIPNPQTISLDGGSRVEFKTFESESLGSQASYSVFLPPSYDGQPDRRYPVVYFLHGLNNDHTSWAVERYGNIPAWLDGEMKAGRLPEFVMISPRGGRGFYTDSYDGKARYETYLVRDVSREIESHYRLRNQRSARAIAGTSMGGYGALKIAMKHAPYFATVVAGSPIVFLGDDPLASVPPTEGRFAAFIRRMVGEVFGDPVNRNYWRANSLEQLAEKRDLDGLHIFFLYGTADRYNRFLPLEKGVRRLDSILSERGVEHRFQVVADGPHGWELIRDNLDEVFEFLTQTF